MPERNLWENTQHRPYVRYDRQNKYNASDAGAGIAKSPSPSVCFQRANFLGHNDASGRIVLIACRSRTIMTENQGNSTQDQAHKLSSEAANEDPDAGKHTFHVALARPFVRVIYDRVMFRARLTVRRSIPFNEARSRQQTGCSVNRLSISLPLVSLEACCFADFPRIWR